jgi:hypothetical protein
MISNVPTVATNDREIAQRVNAFASERVLENDEPEAPVVEF